VKELHETQKRLLELLKANIDNPLTVMRLKEELDLSSTSVVQHHILQLERKGYLKRNPNNPKDYIINDQEKRLVYINQYGLAQCGAEGFTLEDSPVDRVPIATKIIKFNPDDAFIVTAKGESMETTISPGDFLVAQQNLKANNGDIIVCVNEGKTIIKRFNKLSNSIILRSDNNDKEKYPDFKAGEDFRIVGIVRNIIKYH